MADPSARDMLFGRWFYRMLFRPLGFDVVLLYSAKAGLNKQGSPDQTSQNALKMMGLGTEYRGSEVYQFYSNDDPMLTFDH